MYRYLLLLPILLTGCGVSSDIDSGNGVAPPDPAKTPLHLQVTVEPTSLELGDAMEVRLVVTNTSSEPVSRFFSSGCTYGFSLQDGAGTIVAPPPPICTMNAPVIVYQPGEPIVRVFRWVWDDRGLEPGAYEVVAGLGPRGEYEAGPPVSVELR